MKRMGFKTRRQNSTGDKGTNVEEPEGERTGSEQEDHLFLDVWSIKQGALRLQTLPISVVLMAILGLYLCIGAVLNYNEVDADQVPVCAR
jgi:hypothetical protein